MRQNVKRAEVKRSRRTRVSSLYSLIEARSRCQRRCVFFIPTGFSLLYRCTRIILLPSCSECDATILGCVSRTLQETEKWSHGCLRSTFYLWCRADNGDIQRYGWILSIGGEVWSFFSGQKLKSVLCCSVEESDVLQRFLFSFNMTHISCCAIWKLPFHGSEITLILLTSMAQRPHQWRRKESSAWIRLHFIRQRRENLTLRGSWTAEITGLNSGDPSRKASAWIVF